MFLTDPTLLDVGWLEAALETGVFEPVNIWVHQNLVLHHLRTSMCCSMILFHEACHMVGSPYRPAELNKISWQDLQWMGVDCRASPVPVQEEVVVDEVTGVVTTVVLPDRAESSDEESKESTSLINQ